MLPPAVQESIRPSHRLTTFHHARFDKPKTGRQSVSDGTFFSSKSTIGLSLRGREWFSAWRLTSVFVYAPGFQNGLNQHAPNEADQANLEMAPFAMVPSTTAKTVNRLRRHRRFCQNGTGKHALLLLLEPLAPILLFLSKSPRTSCEIVKSANRCHTRRIGHRRIRNDGRTPSRLDRWHTSCILSRLTWKVCQPGGPLPNCNALSSAPNKILWEVPAFAFMVCN